jgi:hypothetical protein
MSTKFKIFLVFFIALIAFLIVFPFLFGFVVKTTDLTFTRLYSLYSNEIFYYLTLGPIQVPDGGLFFEDRYNRVEKGFHFINVIGYIIYQISSITNLDIETSFLTYKIIVSFFCVISVIFVLIDYIKYNFVFVLVLLSFIFSAGIGWANIISLGWDITAPEMNVFISLTTEYYLPLAILFFNLSFGIFFKLLDKFSIKYSIYLGLSLLGLGIIYIYSLVILSLFIFLYFCYLKFTQHPNFKNNLFIFTLIPIPVVFYYCWLYLTILGDDGRSDGWIMGPKVLEYFVTYFWYIIALLLLLIANRQTFYKNKIVQVCLAYIIYHFIISRIPPPYFPFQVQSYVGLSFCYIIPISILLNTHNFNIYNKILIVLLVFVSSVTNIFFYNNLLKSIQNTEYPIFISKNELYSYQKIKKLVEKKSKICICQEKAMVTSYYTGAFVSLDVVPDYIEGENKKFWNALNNVHSRESDIVNHFKANQFDYLYIDQSNPNCKLNDDIFKKMILSSKLLFHDKNIYFFKVK